MSGTQRILRKQTGNFLEDFVPGQVFRHKGGKTVTEGLFTTFTEFAMTANPLAKNARYARAYGYDGLVCPPGVAMLVAFSQTVEDVSENARANLEYIDMRFGAPVYVGDTIEVETQRARHQGEREPPEPRHRPRAVDGAQEHRRVATRRSCSPGSARCRSTSATTRPACTRARSRPRQVECSLWLPPYSARTDYKSLAHLSSRDSYFEDLEPGTRIEHSRGRTMTSEHIHLTAVLDNTSQVHCNQFMIDLDPQQYVGGQLIIFGGIPFVLCLGLSSPDVGDNALGDIAYRTGRHTAPLFAGDTVFAATEVRGKRDFPGRPDLGVVETRLLGHKFERDANARARRRAAGLEEDPDLRARARDRRQAAQPLRGLEILLDPAPVALGRLRAGDRDVAAGEPHGRHAADARARPPRRAPRARSAAARDPRRARARPRAGRPRARARPASPAARCRGSRRSRRSAAPAWMRAKASGPSAAAAFATRWAGHAVRRRPLVARPDLEARGGLLRGGAPPALGVAAELLEVAAGLGPRAQQVALPVQDRARPRTRARARPGAWRRRGTRGRGSRTRRRRRRCSSHFPGNISCSRAQKSGEFARSMNLRSSSSRARPAWTPAGVAAASARSASLFHHTSATPS